MSTYWGYVCLSHDPPIESDRMINHGADRLAEVFKQERAGEWPDDPRYTAWRKPMLVDGYCGTAPIDWLRQHPHCQVALRSEYGDTKPL